jgi:hypothetical protein
MVTASTTGETSGDGRSLAYQQGVAYLQAMQHLALDPAMVTGLQPFPGSQAIVAWIGTHQQRLNAQIQAHLQACHECFHPHARPPVQLFAVPLSPAFGFDGLCNYATQPITLLVDLGRVVPHHWQRLVVHEYAHAQAGIPGHHDRFVAALTHLCLGLGLAEPPNHPTSWPHWPPCQPTSDPLAFWRGQTETLIPGH